MLKFLQKNRLFSLTFFVILGVIFSGDLALAEGGNLAFSMEPFEKFFNVLIKIVSGLIGLLAVFVGWLMTPDWTIGTLFNLPEVFRNIWVLVSNVVYIIFGGLLVWIAFMNIIGAEGETYQLKTALPKFAIGVLIVPFTWLIVQYTLSLSSFLTVSVLGLPADIMTEKELEIKANFPVDGYVVDIGADAKKGADIFSHGETEEVSLHEYFRERPFGIIEMYVFSIFNIQKLGELAPNSTIGEIIALFDGLVMFLFQMVFAIAFFLLLIALFLALFVRVVYIWLYTMFSPVFGLTYFFGSDGGGDSFWAKFNFKEFISLAMVPVYVSAALSFGFLFLGMISKNEYYEGDGVSSLKVEDSSGESNITIGGFTLKVKGGPTDFIDNIGDGTNPNVLAIVFMQLIGICVFWMALMAALRHSEITKTAVEPISQVGAGVAELGKQLPQFAPLPFVGDLKGLGRVPEIYRAGLRDASQKRFSPINDKIYSMMGADVVLKPEEKSFIRNIMEQGAPQREDVDKVLDILLDSTRAGGTTNSEVRAQTKDVLEWLDSNRHKAGIKSTLNRRRVSEGDKLYKDGKVTPAGALAILGDGKRANADSRYKAMATKEQGYTRGKKSEMDGDDYFDVDAIHTNDTSYAIYNDVSSGEKKYRFRIDGGHEAELSSGSKKQFEGKDFENMDKQFAREFLKYVEGASTQEEVWSLIENLLNKENGIYTSTDRSIAEIKTLLEKRTK